MMLLRLDPQGRANLKTMSGGHRLYEATRQEDGTIKLVPVVVVPVSELPEDVEPSRKTEQEDAA